MHKTASSILKGFLSGIAFLLLLCLIASIFQLFFDIPDGGMHLLSDIIISISAYFSAYISTQLCRTRGLLQGLICGILFYIALIALSLLQSSLTLSDHAAKKAFCCLIFGVIGGVRGVNTKKTGL